MNQKILILALLMSGSWVAWSEKAKEEKGNLVVKNGDFSDLAGLQEKADGWFAGMPAGWSGVILGETQVWGTIANVSTLSQITPSFVALTQEVGMVSASCEVTLSFEVSEPWRGEPFILGAAIYDAITNVPLAKGDFDKTGSYSVKANIVPSGTRVKIGFWAGTGTPGIDNVKIEVKALP
jgi:hypothetical protein